MVIAGQSSGHIRIFSIEEKRILTEIMAHVKIISSIDIVLETGMVIIRLNLFKLNFRHHLNVSLCFSR